MKTRAKTKVFSAVLAAGMLGGLTMAAPASAYVAGKAVVNPIQYNGSTGLKTWSCSFTGWAQVGKYWGCEQWNEDRTYVVRSHTGKWSGQTMTTSRFGQNDIINTYAYRAVAGYDDGSSSATGWRWG